MAVPKQDSRLAEFATAFGERVSGHAADYGLTPQQAADFDRCARRFIDTYEAVTAARAGGTLSHVLTIEKNAAKAELRACASSLCAMVQANTAVSETRRAELGVRVRRPAVRRSSGPAERPTVTVAGVNGRTVTLDIGDPSSKTRRARPDGLMCAIVYCAFGEQPPAGLGDWRFCGLATRPGYAVTVDAPPGVHVWFTAVWADRRGRLGEPGIAVSTYLAGGVLPQAHGFRVAA